MVVPPVARRFRPGDLDGIRAVMEASFTVDRMPGQERVDIERSLDRIQPDPEGTVVAELEARVAGYCTPRHDDLLVHPELRRRGVGRALVPAAMDVIRERGLPFLELYVPQHLPASEAFAWAMGLRYHSSLWLCELAADAATPAPAFPPEVTTRRFTPGEPLEAYVELINDTFADHPTPLSWTLDVVRHVHGLPDFDPGGILLVADAADPDRLIGFTRVEVGPDDHGALEGWINLIGVRAAWRGRGLGRELLRWGMRYARDRGAAKVDLSVEALNERALQLYRRHGFVPTIEWPHWIREP
jgi:mycothiol synthase